MIRLRGNLQVIGKIWQPGIGTCAMGREIAQHDIDNMYNGKGHIDRSLVESWIDTNMGDFQWVDDFALVVHDTRGNIVFQTDWATPESEVIYCDIMYNND